MADDEKILVTFRQPRGDGTTSLQLQEVDTDALLLLLDENDSSEAAKRAMQAAKAGQRRDAYRQRLKAEWASLRQQESQLSRRVQALRTDKAAEKSEPKNSGFITMSAWKGLAMRQLENRLEAEAQQKWLQSAVNRRATLIQNLRKTLRERIRAVRRADGGAKHSDKREMSHSHLYATYFHELTSLYKRTDEIFQAVGIESTSGAVLSEMPTRKVDGDSEFFENVDVGRIPFSFQRTCDAVWELASAPHRQAERQVYSGLSDSENSIAVSYCIPCRRENGEVITLRTRLVSRRYVQESRWVVVWRSLSVADGDFAGMNLDETGWCVIQPLSSALNVPDQLSEDATTLVQVCVRYVPIRFATGTDCEPNMDEFAHLLAAPGQENGQEISHMMERLRLDDANLHDPLGNPTN